MGTCSPLRGVTVTPLPHSDSHGGAGGGRQPLSDEHNQNVVRDKPRNPVHYRSSRKDRATRIPISYAASRTPGIRRKTRSCSKTGRCWTYREHSMCRLSRMSSDPCVYRTCSNYRVHRARRNHCFRVSRSNYRG